VLADGLDDEGDAGVKRLEHFLGGYLVGAYGQAVALNDFQVDQADIRHDAHPIVVGMSWVLRAVWVVIPLTVGPALTSALHGHADAVRLTASTAGWALWAVGLVAVLVPHPVALTVIRCVAPLVLVAGIAGGSVLGVAWGAVVVVVAFLPYVAMACVDGPAYANERRFPLAPPGALLLGPVEIAWALLVGLPVVGILLLAARQWALGGVVVVVAGFAGFFLGRALHGLSRRWGVFVPAGFVLHDPLVLPQPVLFRRESIVSLGPAPADSASLDLTQRALGLAVDLTLREEVEGMTAVLFTPSRAGAFLAEAARRRLV
jgi:hypothetical protein